ncbi:aspartate ammonia-lyase [candidate division KSB1 bacterium]|nr:aspartate ammonia-lyase [candidate division KSB1 bacterium]
MKKETRAFRQEKDSLGTVRVPVFAYYGAQTVRAVNNFPVSGQKAHPDFIWASVAVKKAAATVNMELGLLNKNRGEAIIQAAKEIMAGDYNDQFVVDVYQAGAGTSHHMNVNEVLANRAIEILGGERGDYTVVHPNDHVNFGQSTNDVFPTAMRIAILRHWPVLNEVLIHLVRELRKKGDEFKEVIKSGRTHLQDAVPITLGQEFMAYADTLSLAATQIESATTDLKRLGIGGSAAGTGLNVHPDYRQKVVELLKKMMQMDLESSPNLFEAMQSMRPFAAFSGSLRELALELIRIANDFRLLGSGPNTGLYELILPPVQPGSSIMPGKVNPVMAEMLNMVAFQVVGNDTTVAMAAQAGQLELNVMMPVIIHNILQSMTILTNALKAFTERGVTGIKANKKTCLAYFGKSLGLATVLNVIVGYEKAAKIMQTAQEQDKTVLQVVKENGSLSDREIEQVFSAEKLTKPGVPSK